VSTVYDRLMAQDQRIAEGPTPRHATAYATSPVVSTAIVRAHAGPLLRLAVPVVLAELGWMTMGLVDTIMVGPLGPDAIGAVGLGGSLFMAVAIFGMGMLLGLDTLVSQAFGARRLDECHRWLRSGLLLGAIIAVPFTIGLVWASDRLDLLGLHPDVERLTSPYLGVVSWSLPVLLCYAAFRRYLQGMSVVRPIMFALVSANLVNVAANWTLIYGHFGAPALGVAGAAWATNLCRLYLAAVLLGAILVHDRRTGGTLRRSAAAGTTRRLRRLIALSLPAALQVTLEVGVFAAATALAGKLSPVALAAHQVALNIAAFVFMVPLGMASAGAVLVGQHIGRGDRIGAARAGWTALVTIACFMLVVAMLLVLAPRLLLIGFTRDAQVLAIGATLLAVAAVFQLFDGLQVVATGILRGIGDTRTPMIWNLAGHWFGGLPIGWTLCFVTGFGVLGLWIGLSVGLTIVGIVLVFVWSRRVRALVAADARVKTAAGLLRASET
jgi:MATE family multidrug resistance protein